MNNLPGNKRLRFDLAEVSEQEAGVCLVRVVFTFGDESFEASATDTDESKGFLKAAARAALKAIELAVEGRFSCELVDLDHVNALGKELVAVLVDVGFEGRQIQVFGSCQKAASEIDAAVKAALNATNRFVDLATRD